jgi:hypothetical protein
MGELTLDLRNTDLAIGIGQKVHAVPRAEEEPVVMHRDRRLQVDGSGRPEPGEIFAPGPRTGKHVTCVLHPVTGTAARLPRMAEGVVGQKPVRMPLSRLGQ